MLEKARSPVLTRSIERLIESPGTKPAAVIGRVAVLLVFFRSSDRVPEVTVAFSGVVLSVKLPKVPMPATAAAAPMTPREPRTLRAVRPLPAVVAVIAGAPRAVVSRRVLPATATTLQTHPQGTHQRSARNPQEEKAPSPRGGRGLPQWVSLRPMTQPTMPASRSIRTTETGSCPDHMA